MFTAKVFYMMDPRPKNWVAKFETLGAAIAEAKERHMMDPCVLGYLIIDDSGNIVKKVGVCVDYSSRH